MLIDAAKLAHLVADIFRRAGCSDAEAERIGRYLVSANLVGHDSHGVVRVPRYVQQLRDGRVVADRTVAVIRETPVMAVLDGQYGFGQTVAPQAVRIGIDKAAQNGLAIVSLRHAGHVGRVGDWAELAAEAGQVSIHFVNAAGSVLVAPFGGVDKRFSTAPFCVGVPRPGDTPLILDFATSIVAEGKVLVAAKGGKPIPEGALIEPDGRLTSDPATLYGDAGPDAPPDKRENRGAIRAMGEHKGSGLALMCELLGGALTGNGAAGPLPRPFSNGMLSIYMTVEAFDAGGGFAQEMAAYLDFVREARPAELGGEVLLPGEVEDRTRRRRRAEGVPLPDEAWRGIAVTAREVGVPEATIDATVG
ncbi:MAG: malate/lactate/ureidoglycolate dehydrogenase [Alphaproteobacteria bacterium]